MTLQLEYLSLQDTADGIATRFRSRVTLAQLVEDHAVLLLCSRVQGEQGYSTSDLAAAAVAAQRLWFLFKVWEVSWVERYINSGYTQNV